MGMGMRIDFENPIGMGMGIGMTFENGYGFGYNSILPVPTERLSLNRVIAKNYKLKLWHTIEYKIAV